MMKTVKPTGRAMSMPGGLALGAVLGLGITLSGSLILTKAVHSGRIHPDNIGYGILILLLIASFTAAMIAKRRIKHRQAMVCMLSGLIYFLILLGITALFFGGQYEGVGVTALLILGGSGAACFTGAGRQRRRRANHLAVRMY